MCTLKNRIAKLIDVKSIVTLLLTGTFVFLSVIGKVSSSQFVEIFLMVIGFYFGVQSKKESSKHNQDTEN